MADVKWIKITTDLFDDEKIKIIDTLPARDEIIVIWFKLLALSGKVNQNGLLLMNNKIAYTQEMLSAIFNRDLNIIKLALGTFERFGMIEIEENEIISITNWEKHQNIDGLDKIREKNALRQRKHRQKQLLLSDSNVTSNVTVTPCHALEEDKEEDKDKKINKQDIDEVWQAYPRKEGKKDSYAKLPKVLTQYTKEQLIKAIKKYTRTVSDKQYLMQGSTFFNGRYLDYIDEQEESPKPKESKVFTPRYKEI